VEDRAQADQFLSPRILRTVAKTNFDFLSNDSAEESIAIALRFVLSVAGVHTAVVGTTKPERFPGKRAPARITSVTESEYSAIRERWDVIAPKTWIGQP